MAVEDLGSLGAAARSLGISQPSASRTVAALEHHVGYSLLRRSPRGSTLTREGLAVAAQARLVLVAQERLEHTIDALADLDGPTRLELAASRTIGEHLVPTWLGSQAARYPDTWVSFRFDNSANVARWVAEGQVPLGFVEDPAGATAGSRQHAPAATELRSLVLGTDHLLVIVPPGHPWAQREVGAAELTRTHLVERERGSGTRATLDGVLPDRAPALTVLDSNSAIVAAVAAGLGPAVLSGLAVRSSIADGAVAHARWTGPELSRPVRALWRREAPLPGPVRDFLGLVREHMSGAE